jgi:peptide/nickel transport system substrate-binding protein
MTLSNQNSFNQNQVYPINSLNNSSYSAKVYEDEIIENSNDWRNILWNYPEFLIKIFNITRPFSLLFFYILFCLNIFNWAIESDFVYALNPEKDNRIVEGTVGELDNLNPIFTSNNPFDKDIHALMYEKFIYIDRKGDPEPGIAKSWEKNSDKEYTFKLYDNLYFHDGEKVTADDVEFTFNTAIKLAEEHELNTIGQALSGVKVEAVNDSTVKFTLSEVSATFFEAVSVYIVPEHYFSQVNADRLLYSFLNEKPIGSGPYKIIRRETDKVVLEASENYNNTPKIKYYEYRLFTSFDTLSLAYYNNLLDTVSHAYFYGDNFRDINHSFKEYLLPIPTRKRVIFMNTRDSMENIALRQAINYLIDKESLLNNSEVSGEVIYSPINEESWAYSDDFIKYEYSVEEANKKFIEAGYKYNEDTGYYQDDQGKILALTLSYLDNDINRQLAKELKKQLEEHGVMLDIEEDAMNYEDISRKVIATRDFDLLLYEIETTVDPDQYNLWHTLKVDYPNLNLAGKTEKHQAIDTALVEGRLRLERDGEKGRKFFYAKFQKYLMSDSPVVFLYQPYESYFVSEDVTIPEIKAVNYYDERFRNVEEWEIQ